MEYNLLCALPFIVILLLPFAAGLAVYGGELGMDIEEKINSWIDSKSKG